MSGHNQAVVIGGAMAAAVRDHDWSRTPLGAMVDWPAALRVSVNIVLASPFPTFTVWGAGQTLIYNDAYAGILFDKHPSALGRSFRDVWSEIWDALEPLVDRTLVAGEAHMMENVPFVMHRKGYAEETWFNYSYAPIHDTDGTIGGLICTCIETTEAVVSARRRDTAEAALRAREAQAHTDAERVQLALSAGAIIGTWFWDLQADRFTVDEPFARAFGLDPDLGRDGLSLAQVVETVHPEDQAGLAEAIGEAIARGGAYAHQYRVRREDGRYYWIEANGRVDLGPDGTGHSFPGVLLDVEDRRSIEAERDAAMAALRVANEQLKAENQVRTREISQLWEVTRDLMVVVDFDGCFRRVNPAWTSVLGYDASELIGHNISEFVIADDRQRTTGALAGLATGTSLTMVNRYRHKDGSVRFISWTAAPSETMTYATGRDITVERRQADDLEAAQEALRQSQKMEAVGQLTGGVAHDFNNLLTILRSSVDLLRRPDIKEERRARYLDAMSDTVDRAAKLTSQLLAFARRQSLKPEVFDVGAKLKGVSDMLDTVTGARITITVDVPEAPCFVRADVSQFETALVNMAVNARDAMEDEGHLTLSAACCQRLPAIRGHAPSNARFTTVSITDTGSGIPQDQLGQIFEPFFTTKGVGKGTGLGLSQVFGFAKQSGGDVDVHSELGAGTTFTLYLPETSADASTPVSDPDHGPVPGGSGQRILVVEDNVEVGRFCTQILDDLGYRTTWATNAEAALERLGTDGAGFDVVFSDVVMPGMGGVALAEWLRARLPEMPVILASGYSHVLAREDDHGFELLHKPYSAEQLARALQRVMERVSGARFPETAS